MKRRYTVAFAAAMLTLALSSGWAADGLSLDPGGFTVDFSHAGYTKTTGPNLLTNGDMEQVAAGRPAGWQTGRYVWLAAPDAALQAAIEKRAYPLMRWGLGNRAVKGKVSARLSIPMAAYNPADPPGHEFCAMYHQQITLPPPAVPTQCVLFWQQRGHSAPGVPNSRAYTRITFYDNTDLARAKQTRVYAQTIFKPGDRWRRGELPFVVPRKTRLLDVRLALTGVGEVEFDDVALRRMAAQESGVTTRLMPLGLLDKLYCLPTGSALTMIFGFRNSGNAAIHRPQLVLQLPSFVEVMETAPALPVVGSKPRPDGLTEYRYDLTPIKGRIHGPDFPYPWNQWQGLCLFVQTRQQAADRLYPARYWIEDDSYRSPAQSFNLRVVAPLPTVAAPKLFRSGAQPFLIWSASKPETIKAFAHTFQQVGFNCVHTPPCPLGDEFGRLGLERFTQPFANGYTMGGPKPDQAAFRDINGKAVPGAICPTEVYRRGPYFENVIVSNLRKLLVTDHRADQLMCNWEPHMYQGKGCYCDRCKEEFTTFSKLPAAEVDAMWPKTVAEKEPELLHKFRCWQHAQVMITLEETAQELGKEAGREIHFIPELSYLNLTSAWNKSGDSLEFAAVDYIDKLPVLNAWGPYNWYVFGRGPYDYVRGRHLSCHATAQEVQQFLRSRVPGRKPRLYAFPYGTYEGATEPEAISCEFLTYFLDGYEGALAYLFPGGYDGRYWRALADTNRQIAQFESYVRLGQPLQRHSLAPATPLPAPDPRFLDGCGMIPEPQRWRKMSLLQSWEFERNGKRLIAVGNFWERGECFFRLKLQVQGKNQYVLREPMKNRVYANAQGDVALSPAELARGVLLHAGAMRFAFFVLEPYDPHGEYGQVVRPQQMAAAMQQRLPAIQKAAAQ